MAEPVQSQSMHREAGAGARVLLFVRRALAWLLDSILINGAGWGISLGLLYVAHWFKRAAGGPSMDFEFFVAEFNGMVLQGMNLGVTLAIAIAIQVYGLARSGTTPGKRAFFLSVRDARTGGVPSMAQSWRRFLYSGVSYLPFLAGYLMALFQREGLALHDLLAGTRVVPRSKA